MGILAFAYACEPGKGSEPGVGWDWARLLASLDETIVITRANNARPIERCLQELPERERPRFVYVDLPSWARIWKRGPRGARIYYMLWQLAALKRARRLRKDHDLDVVWHLTFANAWLGSLAPLAGGTFVLGPVGGGMAPPPRLFLTLGARGAIYEIARELGRGTARFLNPVARLAWSRASLILAQNNETRAWLPRRHRSKTYVFPNALIRRAESVAHRSSPTPTPTLLFAGRLVPWKGGALAIRTLVHLPEWKLIICGSGPDERRLRHLAARSGVANRTEFRGWLDRDSLMEVMTKEADVLICASLREEAGLVVAEARALGLPVVSLDRGGPPLLGAQIVRISFPGRTALDLAAGAIDARARHTDAPIQEAEYEARLRTILAGDGRIVRTGKNESHHGETDT